MSWDEQVRRVLLQMDITNRDISDRSGVSRSTVNWFMQGNRVRSGHFQKLAIVAGFRLEDKWRGRNPIAEGN